jgi:hypothetical protein
VTADAERLVDLRFGADRPRERGGPHRAGAAEHELFEAADPAAQRHQLGDSFEKPFQGFDRALISGLKHRDRAGDHDRRELALAGIER